MTLQTFRAILPLAFATTLAACGGAPTTGNEASAAASTEPASDRVVTLTPQQIEAAGILLVRPTVGGGAGAIELPATIAGDPQGIQIVSAAIGGRIVTLTRNLGETVRRGDTLAIIESREAAQLKGQVEASQARASLAQSQLRREQRLFAERVSPEQDLIAAQTAAAEANIALRQAQQQLSAAGGGGGALNRLALSSPIGGQIIARSAMLGQTVVADAELYRVANLSTVSLSISLSPVDAGLVRPGAPVSVTTPGRQGTARVTFVSPVLDAQTKLVPVIATMDNRGGQWRVGESINAAIELPGKSGSPEIAIPQIAVQSLGGKTVVFVRTPTGFKAVPVKVGAPSGDRVIIVSGLIGREQVAATNSFTLKAELGKSEGEEE
ncbi:efflux RND transporter periplasmic adaptor subunit (plasmid) [Sphingomonas paeninsulae]|uniref:Efflux RND transporter periplasmic adaptor subunit n=1 Tax=Sphingomonas paeninsulae TaxID=2319844 RepID=A0A494TG36_SPHPE|nr:efflux RND transporter periplasmic adaptor subunit [Sphingomonas paeninsulae]AYJ84791.1 efflux RND transporter periplasmic adaptor subunit [Sphingomonas paeninsulae]